MRGISRIHPDAEVNSREKTRTRRFTVERPRGTGHPASRVGDVQTAHDVPRRQQTRNTGTRFCVRLDKCRFLERHRA